MATKKKNIILETSPELTVSGTRYFQKLWIQFKRIQNRFNRPKYFNITEIHPNNLNLFQEFVLHYRFAKQTMMLQDRIQKKSEVFEASFVAEYQWFYLLSAENKSFLNGYGLNDVLPELEAFIIKWNYTPLKRQSRKVVNYLPAFLTKKS